MNILFIAPRVPLPADTGAKIRTWNIIKQLATSAQVDVVSFSFSEDDVNYLAEMKASGVNVELVPMKDPGILTKIFKVLFHSQPFSIAKYNTKEMMSKVQEMAGKKKYDVFHIDHLHMAHYADVLDRSRCVLDEHNVEYKILERCANVETNAVKKWIFTNQAKKMKRFERDQAVNFAVCCTVSKDDKKILEDITDRKARVQVIPNGVDTDFFELPILEREEDALVFTGSMDWLPNDDAMIFFLDKVLPLLRSQKSDLKLYIVGKSPSAKVVELAGRFDGVEVTGRVDDVRTYIQKSKVFIVPIRVGGGTRLKILEAMSMQKAVVSTTVGAEGIAHKDGVDIILADTPDQITQRILELLEDDTKRKSMGPLARELVCRTYDWRVVGKTLIKIAQELSSVNN